MSISSYVEGLAIKPVLIGSAILVAALAIGLGVQTVRLAGAQSKEATAKADLEVARGKLVTANDNVKSAQTSADGWKAAALRMKALFEQAQAENSRIDRENDDAISKGAAREQRLRAELSALQQSRRGALSDPKCAQFLEMPLCPALRSSQ